MAVDAPPRILRRLVDRYAAMLVSTLGERLVSVVLFGSVARGDASDADDAPRTARHVIALCAGSTA